jgi:hypothetical protein
MIRIAISVEGPTEREFCKYVLSPFLTKYNISIDPIVITTSKDKNGKKNRGGAVNIDRIKNEVKKLLPSYDYVTTLYDFYGFKSLDMDTTVEDLETSLYDIFNTTKFIPYIQKYEFETLLFAKPEYYKDLFNDKRLDEDVLKIIDEFKNIEMINNSKQTAPSKRLINIFEKYGEKYDKVFYGVSIAQDIGIETICKKATRFNLWIEKLIKSIN